MTPNQLSYFRFSVRQNDAATRKVLCDPPDINLDPIIVDIVGINKAAESVRKALARFVGQCLDKNAGGVARSGKHLKELAKCGNELYWALFDDKVHPDDARQMRDWIEGAAGSHRMNVIIDDRTYVPWGLVYDGDPDKLSGNPDDIDIAQYENFWALKYFVSPFYKNIGIRGINRKPIALYRLVSALHQDAFPEAEACIKTNEPERAVLEWMRQNFATTKAFNAVYNKTDLFDCWGTQADLDMIFFYCHANETNIEFNINELLTMEEINRFQQKQEQRLASGSRSGCLFFMNGCATAVGSADGGFLEVTGRKSACGFIGTETDIPDLFALRFGLAFLYHFLLEGRPVYEVMSILRRNHWPLSVLYTTYCSPGLQVVPPDQHNLNVSFDNFSRKQLGTTDSSLI